MILLYRVYEYGKYFFPLVSSKKVITLGTRGVVTVVPSDKRGSNSEREYLGDKKPKRLSVFFLKITKKSIFFINLFYNIRTNSRGHGSY